MNREQSEPTQNKWGADEHPAFGVIGVNRSSYGSNGASLFDSDVRHRETITVTISTASRQRKGNHDYIHPRQELVEVEMSLAQWASFVSSMNNGSGVPCTIRRTETNPWVDTFPHEARLQESMTYAREAAERAFADIRKAFALVQEKSTKTNIEALGTAIRNARPNVDYATKTLVEHSENVVQRARADVEAMVVQHARALQLEPGDVESLRLALPDAESRVEEDD